MMIRLSLLLFAGLASLGTWFAMKPAKAKAVPVCSYRIVRDYPHDSSAFTEGLFFKDGLLFESTGREGQSRITVRTLESLSPLREAKINPAHFGEGVIDWQDQLISLTWRDGVGYRWDAKTMKPLGTFNYGGEGWGMTRDDKAIYQSDGSHNLLVRDPLSFEAQRSIAVTANGEPVINLNELEWIDGEIWANVWMTDRIVRIDPASGKVKAWLDLKGLRAKADATRDPDALPNGIAYDAKAKRIFVTGKNWTKLFEIKPRCAH